MTVSSGDLCVLSGLVRVANVQQWGSFVIGMLPEACRPADGTLRFLVDSNRQIHHISVRDSRTSASIVLIWSDVRWCASV